MRATKDDLAGRDGDGFEPLSLAAARAGLGYWTAWRAVTSRRVPSQRDRRGRRYARVSDLKKLVERETIGAQVGAA